LSNPLNLSLTRWLRIAVDEQPAVDIDVAAQATDVTQVSLNNIVSTINLSLGAAIASAVNRQLVLRSPQTGPSSRLSLEPVLAGDARNLLFGDVAPLTVGAATQPATLTSEDLLQPVDLEQRRWLRLAVDRGPGQAIEVAGAAPRTTFLDEIVTAINRVFPGLASATSDNRLQLISPTVGAESQISVSPRQTLDLI